MPKCNECGYEESWDSFDTAFSVYKAYHKEVIVGTHRFPWSEIVFIAHDGFPCREVHTSLSLEELDDVANEDSILAMRKTLTQKSSDRILTRERPSLKPKPEKIVYHSGGGGCPFEFEEVEMQIINPPNCFLLDYEETLLCRAKDGAMGMWWNLEDEILDFSSKGVA